MGRVPHQRFTDQPVNGHCQHFQTAATQQSQCIGRLIANSAAGLGLASDGINGVWLLRMAQRQPGGASQALTQVSIAGGRATVFRRFVGTDNRCDFQYTGLC